MVLQAKQAQASVLEAFTHKSAYTKHGHRVVTGQRLMQAASDSFLGWIDGPAGRSFYVRQLRDMKWSPDPASFTERAAAAVRTAVRPHPGPRPRPVRRRHRDLDLPRDRQVVRQGDQGVRRVLRRSVGEGLRRVHRGHHRRTAQRPRGRRRRRGQPGGPTARRAPRQRQARSQAHSHRDVDEARDEAHVPCHPSADQTRGARSAPASLEAATESSGRGSPAVPRTARVAPAAILHGRTVGPLAGW